MSDNRHLKMWYFLCGAALLIVLVLSFYKWDDIIRIAHEFKNGSVPDDPRIADPYEFQLANSKEFLSCTENIRSERYQDAVTACEASLASATDPRDKLYIKYPLALAYTGLRTDRDFFHGLDLFYEILVSSDAPNPLKAQCIRSLDSLISSANPVNNHVMQHLLEKEYFQNMSGKNPSQDVFSRALLEAGSNYKPLAGIEYRLATMYAQDLLRIVPRNGKNLSSVEKSRINDLEVAVRKKMLNGDADLAQNADLKEFGYLRPLALFSKAKAADYYASALHETPYGEPGTLYQTALDAAISSDQKRIPLISFAYAAFLGRQTDQDNKTEITSLLNAIVTLPDPKTHYMGLILRWARTDNSMKYDVIRLARVDERLKSLLLKLGWGEADFQ